MIMAGYAQVTLVGVDLDHVTTSRHDPQAAEYGGTVTLRARSRLKTQSRITRPPDFCTRQSLGCVSLYSLVIHL